MNQKDLINFVVSLVASIVAIFSTFYQDPIVGLVVLGFGVAVYIGYVVYQAHHGTAGNFLLRFSPVVILVIVGGIIYWFWPSTLKVVLYADLNSNGRRDKGEPPIHREAVAVTDSQSVSRTESTDSDGEFTIQTPRGEFRLKIRGLQIMGDVNRGNNRIYIGFPSAEDTTPPETRIFLGNELGIPASEVPPGRIYAHLWYQDLESKIDKMEIDWGEGRGWEKIDLDQATMNYYTLQHQYKSLGSKTVRLKVTNSKGLRSFPEKMPMMRANMDFVIINIRKVER